MTTKDYEPTDWTGLTGEPDPARWVELNIGSERPGSVPSFLIVSWPTGIHYSNQVGGHACHHPSLEGFLIPILQPIDFDCCSPIGWGPLEVSDADAADALLAELTSSWSDYGLMFLGYTAKVNRDKLPLSSEAWIWLTLTKDGQGDGLRGLPDELEAVWTFENSD